MRPSEFQPAAVATGPAQGIYRFSAASSRSPASSPKNDLETDSNGHTSARRPEASELRGVGPERRRPTDRSRLL